MKVKFQRNALVENFQLPKYVSKHQFYQDSHVQPLHYPVNPNTHRSAWIAWLSVSQTLHIKRSKLSKGLKYSNLIPRQSESHVYGKDVSCIAWWYPRIWQWPYGCTSRFIQSSKCKTTVASFNHVQFFWADKLKIAASGVSFMNNDAVL